MTLDRIHTAQNQLAKALFALLLFFSVFNLSGSASHFQQSQNHPVQTEWFITVQHRAYKNDFSYRKKIIKNHLALKSYESAVLHNYNQQITTKFKLAKVYYPPTQDFSFLRIMSKSSDEDIYSILLG